MKKVSLILTTYNCREDLKKTLKSIEIQDYPDIEVCIADGCSTDGTIEVIQEFQKTTKRKVCFQSEKDAGIYDGINKAIRMSTGDYLEIMNDEYTMPDAVSKLVSAIEKSEEYVGAHADLIYCGNGQVKRYWRMNKGSVATGWMPGHPTLMLKREIYEKYGLYNVNYRCSADYELMLRFLKDKHKLAYVPEVLVSMFYGGTSTQSTGSYWISIKEAAKALKENGYKFSWVIIGLRTCRVLKQFTDVNKNREKYRG